MKSCISVGQKKDQIIIKIADNAGHEEIMNSFIKKILAIKRLYRLEELPIYICGKVLKNKEIDDIQELFQSEIGIKPEFETPKYLGLHVIKRAFNKEIQTSDTKFHKGSVRSGQKLEFEGSIVILGDVNSGAEIVAGENIVVLGALRGVAHAGAKGNKEAFIAAAYIDAPQVRIANIVQEIERDTLKGEDKNYVYVDEEDKIVIE